MEPTDSGRELLENVTMAEAPPFMIQRVESQLLTSELLPAHGGLVVDMSSSEYLPNVSYTTEDLLGHDLTEEDRNLAAALVAVQLVQQQKQQQLNQDSNVIMNTGSVSSLVAAASLDDGKDDLSEQHQFVMSAVDKPVLSAIETTYISTMDGRHLHAALPPLKKYGQANVHLHERYESESVKTEFVAIKNEIEQFADDSAHQRDSDCDAKNDVRASKKSLPHKKRISRKLKKTCSISRKGHKCHVCSQVFVTSDELSDHSDCHNVNIIVQPNVFSCQICSTMCKDQLRFFEHLKTHYEPAAPADVNHTRQTQPSIKNEESKDSLLSSLLPPLNCLHCGKNFRRQKAFEAHVRDVHTNKVEEEFSEPEDLMEGIRGVVEANDRDSGEEAADTKGWYRGERAAAAEAAVEQVCHLCGQLFGTSEEALQHLQECRAADGGGGALAAEERAAAARAGRKKRRKAGHLACLHCDRIFSHRNSLMYHMQGHTGERPHQCDICGKSFFASSALKVHMRLHSGDKPYKCEYCGRHFRQWGDLKYHCISIHSDQKQYQCEYCGKDFARKYSLIVHRRIHTGEKNYRCEFCGKTFRASSYLQNHRRIHTGEKPHPCEVCGKPFRVRSDMKRHLNTHSRRRTGHQAAAAAAGDAPAPDKAASPAARDEDDDEQPPDPLDAVREGTNTLFTNGHQLFICYPGELPVRSTLETQWIQTDN